MLYLPSDEYVGGSIERYGEYSPMEIVLFQHLIDKNDVVVEAGANMGALTIPLAQLAGKVYAFEPQLVLCKIAQANLAFNDLDNVELHNQAVGDVPGEVLVPIFQYDHAANYGMIGEQQWGKGVPVQVVTIDSLGLDRLDFLKVDVEGMEERVLRGAAATIAAQRPLVFVENDRAETSKSLVEYIQSLDYTPYWFATPLYHPSNFYQNDKNDFGNQCSFNMFCNPNEKRLCVEGLVKVNPSDDVRERDASEIVLNLT